jgi:hypothetical protein
VASKGEIVQQVSGAWLILRVYVLQQVGRILDQPQQVVPDTYELVDQPCEVVLRFPLPHERPPHAPKTYSAPMNAV